MKLKFLALPALALFCLTASAEKKALDQSVYADWKSIAGTTLTDSGEWAYYTINAQRGDGTLFFMHTPDQKITSIERGAAPMAFNNGTWATFQIKAPFADTRQAKIDKVKKDKMPKDTTAVINFADMSVVTLPKADGYKSSAKGSLLLYNYEVTPEVDTTNKEAKKAEKFNRLVIWDVAQGDSVTIDSVKSYSVSEMGNLVLYTVEADSLKQLYAYTPQAKKNAPHTLLWSAEQGSIAPGFALDKEGTQGAFLVTTDTVDHALYDLYYFTAKELQAIQIENSEIAGLIPDYAISRFGSLSFNVEGNRLQFNIAPKPRMVPKDTLPADEKFNLELWSWQDTILQAEQTLTKKKMLEQVYTAAYFPKEDRALALGEYNLERIIFAEDGDAPYALGITSKPYSMFTKNEVRPYVGTDTYLIDLKTGGRTLIRENGFGGSYFSPSAEWVAYYNLPDSSWYSINTKTLQNTRLADDIPYPFYNEDDDHPAAKPLYGMYGWTTDEMMLVPDRYDLWLVDPAGVKASVNLTKVGRDSDTQFKLVRRNNTPGKNAINLKEDQLFLSFNRVNKENGYYMLDAKSGLRKLVEGPYIYKMVARAKESDEIIYTREDFNEFPNLYLADKEFAGGVKFTDANPQQADYKWGSVDLINWIDFNGEPCEGLIHYPEDYDPSKKYPVIVYFYEVQTFLKYRYNSLGPSRSIINPVYCTSNDYIVFIPDNKYRDGFPGQSCYDVVVSGTMALIDRGIADPDRIGLQGQSWGGYQTAWLVTQTDLYACSAPGAAVSNMISAYGGIRWGSGHSRATQYENGQSRIGATPWQRRDLYIENSPVFFADRVTTPQLLRHSDKDGAVPYEQGLEYFIALRRLGVPTWMLNYSGDEHNLMHYGARMDWDKRMYQFFDYYLKGAPMPRWMKEGIRSTERDIDQKLDLVVE